MRRNLTESEEFDLLCDNADAKADEAERAEREAEASVCPSCKIAFDADEPRDRQAKGFAECIDCVIAVGREMELDPQDLEDYQTRERHA